MRHKDPGIRRTIHRMLVHQRHTETKKGKEKAVTSKTKHDEQRAVRKTESETKRATGSVCVCVRERETERGTEREHFAG